MTKKQVITVSVDSTADLTKELYEKYKIQVLPLGVVIGEKAFKDNGVDVTPKDIYEAVEKKNIIPKSQAASEMDYTELFEKNKASDFHIHFSISDKLSASQGCARRAAKDFKNVHIVDSKVLSSGTGILAIKAREMEEAGKSAEEIIKRSNELADKQNTSFILDNLKYLHKGGRVSGLKLLGANLLRINPQMKCDSTGALVQGKKFMGNFARNTIQYINYVVENAPNADKDLTMLTYTDIDPAIVKACEEELKKLGFKRVFKTTAGSVITCHCGRNTIGILFTDK
jgi:DegV family protein with EDD domain